MKAWLRFVFLLVNALLVVLAVVTVGGRLLVREVEDLEDEINGLIDRFGIELRNVSGRWRGLNPILAAESVRFPGGLARTVVVELDLVESALRGSVVAHRLSIEHLEIVPTRTLDRRWTLGGRAAGAGGGFDPLPFLEYSDQLYLPDVRIRVMREVADNLQDPLEVLAELSLAVRVINEFTRHSGQVLLSTLAKGSGPTLAKGSGLALVEGSGAALATGSGRNQEPCAICRVDLRWDLSGLLVGIGLEGEVALRGDQFRVPTALGTALGMGGATFTKLRGGWSVSEGDGTGSLAARLEDIVLANGAIDAIDLELAGSSRLWHRDIRAEVRTLTLRAGAHETALDGWRVALRSGLIGTALEWSAPKVDIAVQVPIVRSAFGAMRWAQEWLPALEPRGTIEKFSGRFTFEDRRLSLAGTIDDIAMEHYKGSPYVRDGRAKVIGSERGLQFHLDGKAMTVGLLDVYPEPTRFDALAGDVHIWFKDRFLMVRGEEFEARLGAARLRGEFGVSRPQDPAYQRVSLWIAADELDALVAKRFVPQKLSPNLIRWIEDGVMAGSARNAAVAFHGYLRPLEDLPVRQVELRFDVAGGAVRFHPDWPLAAAVDGTVVVSANGVRADLSRATLRGIELDSGRVELPKLADYVHFSGRGLADGRTLRDLIDDSPLKEWLAFVRPEWQFAGPLDYEIEFTVPTKESTASLAVSLDANLRGLSAHLTNLELVVGEITGPVSYRYPHDVHSPGLDARMFAEPAHFDVATDGGSVVLGFAGRSSVPALTDWLDLDVGAALTGSLAFEGELLAWPGTEKPLAIAVRSDLLGTEVALPAPFSKGEADSRTAHIRIEPAADALVIHAEIADLGKGWLRRPDGGGLAGIFVLAGEATPVDAAHDELTLSGAIEATDLNAWLRLSGLSGAERRSSNPAVVGVSENSVPLGLSKLRIGSLTANEMVFTDLVVDASLRDGAAGVSVVSEAIDGSLQIPVDGPAQLELHHLRLPQGDESVDKDPLADIDMSFIDAVDVRLEEATVGDSSYGKWSFALRRDADVVRLEELVGDLRGLRIEADEPVLWRWRGMPETVLAGRVSADDLAPVLASFGYAGSVETKKVSAGVALRWPGSPLNFALIQLAGTLDAKAKDGRFVDVQSGGGPMRVFSLLNFTAITKRLTLDFSDVFGKGVPFEVLTARVSLDSQRLTFIEPMEIDGTGAYFRVSGTVDLASGALENEMIVTLPVSKSLPWYAAYLGFVNPLAAGAVLLGERVFRNQIKQFSSATYKVRGTLDDPDVAFVGIFGRPSEPKGETPAKAGSPDKTDALEKRDNLESESPTSEPSAAEPT